ncbi:phosphotransferase enzyme family protein [Kribbella sp. CA-253562]|uniref:phosphotransferase enzyme family protein n=1 Tax=Kribbella sp. CA-253562 TaxID=3239942 RepID=UPI003D8E61B4
MTPSSHRAEPTVQLLEAVRHEYALTDLAVTRDLGGNFNLNLQISTQQGHFVVRACPPWVTPDRLTAVQAVRAHLRVRDWPIPQTLRTRTGASMLRTSDHMIEVEQFVEPRGVPMTTWPTITAALPWLARLHDALLDAPSSPAAADPPFANHVPPHTDLTLAITAIRTWDLPPTEATYLNAAALNAAAHLAASLPHPALPTQLVHGDFWATNVHLSGDRLTLLLDFDFLGDRARVDDLALTLFFINEHLGRDDVTPSRLAALRQLVDSYDSALTTPLTEAERAALPHAILRTPLTFLQDLAYLGPTSRAELTSLRGPQYEWALGQLNDPTWLSAFV